MYHNGTDGEIMGINEGAPLIPQDEEVHFEPSPEEPTPKSKKSGWTICCKRSAKSDQKTRGVQPPQPCFEDDHLKDEIYSDENQKAVIREHFVEDADSIQDIKMLAGNYAPLVSEFQSPPIIIQGTAIPPTNFSAVSDGYLCPTCRKGGFTDISMAANCCSAISRGMETVIRQTSPKPTLFVPEPVPPAVTIQGNYVPPTSQSSALVEYLCPTCRKGGFADISMAANCCSAGLPTLMSPKPTVLASSFEKELFLRQTSPSQEKDEETNPLHEGDDDGKDDGKVADNNEKASIEKDDNTAETTDADGSAKAEEPEKDAVEVVSESIPEATPSDVATKPSEDKVAR